MLHFNELKTHTKYTFMKVAQYYLALGNDVFLNERASHWQQTVSPVLENFSMDAGLHNDSVTFIIVQTA